MDTPLTIGFYWVKTPEEYDFTSPKWEIAFYNPKSEEFELCGQDGSFSSDFFIEIKPTPLAEPK